MHVRTGPAAGLTAVRTTGPTLPRRPIRTELGREGHHEGVSSLQCPATLLLSPCDAATTPGLSEEAARSLAERLASRRVAALWTTDTASARAMSDLAADALGCRADVRRDLDARDADESDSVAVERLRDALQEAADIHRGEVVLLLVDAALLRLALPRMAAGVRGDMTFATGDVVELEVDEEWRLRAPDRDASA